MMDHGPATALDNADMNRRSFLKTLALSTAAGGLCSTPAWAIGPSSRLSIAMLRYAGNWNPRPNGLRKMLQEVEKRTSIAVSTRAVHADLSDRERLLEHPLMFWAGDSAVPNLTAQEVDHLRVYLKAGGTLVVDDASSDRNGIFERSVREQLRRVLPTTPIQAVPRSHVLYKSFYLIPEPVGRIASAKKMDGLFNDDRAMVLISSNDLLGAWSRDSLGRYEFDVFPGGDRQREMSYRLGINIVMYALCLNYKEDQVHVPFILKRRKWRVD
ncbi:MAG: DUF4159 domain-containing protein [Myxococcota bacterium]